MLPLVRVFWVSVRNHHLGQRQSVENRSNVALVIVGDVVEDDSFLVIESNMNIPVLPVNDSSIDLEGDPLRLCDIDRLDIRPVSIFGFDARWVVVVGLGLIDWSADLGDINVDNFLLVGVENWAEVEGE